MLVLTRKTNEEILVDHNIRIRIIELSGGKVRIGIEAPREVSIRRGELQFREESLAGVAASDGYVTACLAARPR